MVAHVRIDERLLHGQVAVKWVNYTKATDIMLIDDQVANDSLQKNLFLAMSPQGKTVYVTTVQNAIQLLQGDELSSPDHRVLIVTKLPSVVLRLYDAGIPFTALNVGNMSARGTRKQVYRFFFADAEEQGQLKQLIEHGIDVYYQEIPLEKKAKDIKKLLK